MRRSVDECLRRGEVKAPELESLLVTVPEVSMSPDLKHAAVYVAPLGGGDGEALAKLLNAHKKAIRGKVARDMTTKFTPDLNFVADTRFDEASKIDALLRTSKVAPDLQDDD